MCAFLCTTIFRFISLLKHKMFEFNKTTKYTNYVKYIQRNILFVKSYPRKFIDIEKWRNICVFLCIIIFRFILLFKHKIFEFNKKTKFSHSNGIRAFNTCFFFNFLCGKRCTTPTTETPPPPHP